MAELLKTCTILHCVSFNNCVRQVQIVKVFLPLYTACVLVDPETKSDFSNTNSQDQTILLSVNSTTVMLLRTGSSLRRHSGAGRCLVSCKDILQRDHSGRQCTACPIHYNPSRQHAPAISDTQKATYVSPVQTAENKNQNHYGIGCDC